MLGVAVLALASCNKNDIEPMTQEQRVNAIYDQAFINAFGKPAANHTWGFNGTTRAGVNVNGNMWAETPEVTAAEAAAVYAYVNRVKTNIPHYSEEAPDNLTNYYVTQVWGGQETDANCVYSNFDNTQSGLLGSANMNNLHIAQSGTISIDVDGHLVGDWVHINNFNAGSNTNYGGNTLITDGGTLDFAYESSQDSKYHNKWIIIDGQYITDADDVNHAGKYYVCFDFVSWTNDVYTNVSFRKSDETPVTAHIEGAYTTFAAAQAAIAYVTWWEGETKIVSTIKELVAAGAHEWQMSNINQSNMYYPANDYYTDWIIRLVAAQPKVVYDGRIMGEDLSATENSDFDFNDVVFDYKITSTGAKILLQAAGGTLPLKIGGTATSDTDGVEVHGKFGVNTNIMVNTATDASPKIVIRPAVSFEIEGKFAADGSDIPVFVKKNGEWMELTARRGNPASKFRCKTTTKWVDEYINIDLAYPKFGQWVTDGTTDWESEVVEKYVNLTINQEGDNK